MRFLATLFFLVSLALFLPSVSEHLSSRPLQVKANCWPDSQVVKMISGEYRTVLADWSVVETLFYFGTLVEADRDQQKIRPDYRQMYNNLVLALKLDPYNLDAYYFTQAIFTWDAGRILETNRMLDYGIKYRTWDWQLPFWAGFNTSYFLKDYAAAAEYFQQAAVLSGKPLFTNLAARYLHESGQDALGLAFLDGMIRSTRDPHIRALYQTRKTALEAMSLLSQAVAQYHQHYTDPLQSLSQLIDVGLLQSLPSDPYGGTFFLNESGKVRTTSKLRFLHPDSKTQNNQQGMNRDATGN